VASGADVVLVPEKPIDVNKVAEILKRNRSNGKEYNVVVVSEGAQFQPGDYVSKAGEVDEFGNVRLGGVGAVLADLIEEKTGYETRSVVLGHIQRGGSPSTFDRILATRFGLKAAELALERDYGKMVALSGNRIDVLPIKECLRGLKTLDDEFVALTEAFS
jgi:6-phosphofructokinase 1